MLNRLFSKQYDILRCRPASQGGDVSYEIPPELHEIFDPPWDIAVGVLAIIGQASEDVTLVPNKGEAVSDPRAGRRAGPGCFGLQLFPQPPTRLSNEAKVKKVHKPESNRSSRRVRPLPEVHTGCCCTSQTQSCHQKPGCESLHTQSRGQHSPVGCHLSPLAETTAWTLEIWTKHHVYALLYTSKGSVLLFSHSSPL